jgi:hypothetical protein
MTRPSGFFFLALAGALVFFAPFLARAAVFIASFLAFSTFLAGTAALFVFIFAGFTGVAGLAVSALAIVVDLAFSTFASVAGFVAGFSVAFVSASTPVGSIKQKINKTASFKMFTGISFQKQKALDNNQLLRLNLDAIIVTPNVEN